MRMLSRLALVGAFVFPFTAAVLAQGCGSDGNSGGTASTGTNSSGTAGGTGVGGNGGSTGAAGGSGTGGTMWGDGGIVVVPCQNQVYACADTIDNDGDGLIDWQDPDCLGPCHNSESTFFGSIPGQAGPACNVDCYFDSNSGSGNDECYWNHACDTHSVSPNYYPEPENGAACEYDPGAKTPGTNQSCAQLDAMQSDTCHKTCGPLTPNGCDCFGCCELPGGSGNFVFLGSVDKTTGEPSCSLGNELDPDKCHPCDPVAACLNGCDKCELCLGKDELPPECFPPPPDGGTTDAGTPPPPGQCPVGIQPCGLPGQDPCPFNAYCITGCCQVIPN